MSVLDRDGPGKLWSLWELLELNEEAFCRFSSMIGQMLVVLAQPNLEPDSGPMIDTFKGLATEAQRLGLTSVDRHIARIRIETTTQGRSHQDVRALVVELYNRMRDELSDRLFLAVDQRDGDLYKQAEPLFGAEVAGKFPSIIYDIDEAGKCLALDRSTASAFHAIRSLEAGIRALARCLKIPDPTKGAERSWANVLRDVKGELDKRWPPSTGRMAGDAKLFDEAYAALAGMQNPYRNSTMHLDDKYTKDEAVHIFAVVKGFMRTLATRMDENGHPLA